MTSPLTSGKVHFFLPLFCRQTKRNWFQFSFIPNLIQGRGATLESSQDLSRNSNPLPELDNILKNLSFSSQSLPTTPQSKSPRLTFSADSNFVRPARPKAPLPPESEDRTHRAPHPSLSPPSDHGSGHLRKSSAPASSKSPRTINHPFIESQTRSSSSSLAEQKKPRISPLSRGRTVKWVVEKTPAQLRFVEWEVPLSLCLFLSISMTWSGRKHRLCNALNWTLEGSVSKQPKSPSCLNHNRFSRLCYSTTLKTSPGILFLITFRTLQPQSLSSLIEILSLSLTSLSFWETVILLLIHFSTYWPGKCYARQEPRYIHQLRDESIYFHIPALTRYCDHCLSESTASSSSFEVSSPPTQPEVIETWESVIADIGWQQWLKRQLTLCLSWLSFSYSSKTFVRLLRALPWTWIWHREKQSSRACCICTITIVRLQEIK